MNPIFNPVDDPMSVDQQEEQVCKVNGKTIPEEVLYQIFSYLDYHSLVQAGLSSKQFQRLSSDETLWKRFFNQPFSFKRLFIKRFEEAKVEVGLKAHGNLAINEMGDEALLIYLNLQCEES